MKLIPIFLFCIVTFVSCTPPKEKKYHKKTEHEDIQAIKKEMNASDYNLFIKILEKSKAENISIEGKTYTTIFKEGREFLAKEKEELAKAQQTLKKKRQLKIICSGKWDITYIKITGNLKINEYSLDTDTQEMFPKTKENWIVFSANKDYTLMESNHLEKGTWNYYEDQIVLRTPEKEFNRNVSRNLKIQSISNDEIIVLENEKMHMMDGETNINTYSTLKKYKTKS